MTKLMLLLSAFLFTASCGGEPPADDTTEQAALPGGGGCGIPHCCYQPGYHTINTPACGNGTVLITPTNITSLCGACCVPSILHC